MTAIRPLPTGWRRARLGELCPVVSGSTPKTGVSEYWDGDIPWLTPDDLSRHVGKNVDGGRRSITKAGYESCSTRLVPAGSVLYSSRAPIGYAAIATRAICTNQGFKTAGPSPELVPDFLYWQLLALTDDIRARASGTTFLEISGKAFAATEVVVPPLDEQHRIVAVLENHLSRLDAAGDYTAAASRRISRWKRASLDDIVAQTGSGSCRLSDLVHRIEAGRSFGGSAPPARDAEWGVIRVSAMTWGAFRAQENKAVPKSQVDPRYEIHPGDVLVSRANTTEYVGAPVLVKDTRPRLLLSDKSLRLVPKAEVDARWLVEVLGTRSVRRQVSALATGTKDSMRNISQANLLSVAVPAAAQGDQGEAVELPSQWAIRPAASNPKWRLRYSEPLPCAANSCPLRSTGSSEAGGGTSTY